MLLPLCLSSLTISCGEHCLGVACSTLEQIWLKISMVC
uniref:Uncharacterized protein n=1 Tax=Rhizophora mucronata TaxID=61149 RepID=A0A2P2IXX5_RHIMU